MELNPRWTFDVAIFFCSFDFLVGDREFVQLVGDIGNLLTSFS